MTEATPTPTPAPATTGDPAPAPTPTPTPSATPGADAVTPGSSPEWMASLPEDLRADATLSRFASIDELARGHIEAHKLAKAKAVPLPGDSEESRKAFADALRPQSADAYDFGEVPAVIDGKLVDGFREHAFNIGLPPHMAKETLDFYTKAVAAQVEEANKASQEDVDKFKAEFGGQYDTKLAAVQKMLDDLTGTPMELGADDLNRLDIKLGSSKLVKAMFALHDRIGDIAPAGGDEIPTGLTRVAPEHAETRLDTLMRDAGWREKAKQPGSAEAREAEYLQKMMAQHRVKQNGA